jgi:4-oxalocrotonate tautomerase
MATIFSMFASPAALNGILILTAARCQADTFNCCLSMPSFILLRHLSDPGRLPMPVVHIYMYAGRSKEQKNEMVRRISKDFEEVLSIKPESLNVLFHDVEKSDWGIRGTLASETPPK